MNTSYPIQCYRIWWGGSPEAGTYVGSTREMSLSRRMVSHRVKCKNDAQSNLYTSMREFGTKFNYVRLSEHMVDSFEQQRQQEQRWMDELKPTLNHIRSHCSDEDLKEDKRIHYEKYKEEYRVKRKIYRDKNRDKINAQNREFSRKKRLNLVFAATEKQRLKENAPKYNANRRERQRLIIEAGTFRCEPCDHNFCGLHELTRHYSSQRHQRNTSSRGVGPTSERM